MQLGNDQLDDCQEACHGNEAFEADESDDSQKPVINRDNDKENEPNCNHKNGFESDTNNLSKTPELYVSYAGCLEKSRHTDSLWSPQNDTNKFLKPPRICKDSIKCMERSSSSKGVEAGAINLTNDLLDLTTYSENKETKCMAGSSSSSISHGHVPLEPGNVYENYDSVCQNKDSCKPDTFTVTHCAKTTTAVDKDFKHTSSDDAAENMNAESCFHNDAFELDENNDFRLTLSEQYEISMKAANSDHAQVFVNNVDNNI